jgi:Flp pilus assembly protein TadD
MKCHAGLRFAFLVALVLTTKFAAIAEPPAQKDAVTHDSLGNALSAKGDLDGAIAEYRAAISQQPNYPDAHYNLGIVLYLRGDLDGAVAEWRTVISQQSNP